MIRGTGLGSIILSIGEKGRIVDGGNDDKR